MMRSAFSRILGVLSADFDSEVPRQQEELLLYEYRSFFFVLFFLSNLVGSEQGIYEL
jgi:membrane protein required for beta-lactamase induction